jgi:hypothetical protein
MTNEFLAVLLELLRGRTGKWDVVRDALGSKDDFVRRIAVILTLGASGHRDSGRALSRGGPVTAPDLRGIV